MQRADVMVGMAGIFRILRWCLPRWFWSDDRFFPSCAHVLTKTKQQPGDTIEKRIKAPLNAKMEQLETKMEKLEETLNRQLESILVILKVLQSTDDRGPHISTDSVDDTEVVAEVVADDEADDKADDLWHWCGQCGRRYDDEECDCGTEV